MPLYDFICYQCKVRDEAVKKDFEAAKADPIQCRCGQPMTPKFPAPLVNFNNWKPDYKQMDGEKEFTAAGGYE